MTDQAIIQWLLDEADYWRGDHVDGGPDHPDGHPIEQIVETLTAAATRLKHLTAAT